VTKRNKELETCLLNFISQHSDLFENLYIPSNLELSYYELIPVVKHATEQINSEKIIKDFGMIFDEVIKFLIDNNLPVCLNEEDKFIIENSI